MTIATLFVSEHFRAFMSKSLELRDATEIDVLLWVLRRRSRVKVTGTSMAPLLQPGDELLVNPFAYQQSPPQIGDIVVAWHPQREGFKLIKRVVDVTIDGYWLEGDNLNESTDSRFFGAIPLASILGKVICRF